MSYTVEVYDEVDVFPYIEPRINGKPWKRRVLKKKKKKALKRFDKFIEKLPLSGDMTYSDGSTYSAAWDHHFNKCPVFVPQNVAPIDTGAF